MSQVSIVQWVFSKFAKILLGLTFSDIMTLKCSLMCILFSSGSFEGLSRETVAKEGNCK